MRKTILAVAGVAAFAASPAFAQSSDDMAVLLTTTDSCTVVAADLNFGSSTQVGLANIDGSAGITVTCNPGAAWTVTLDNGDNFNTTRNMSGAGGTVPYGLFSDTARSTSFSSATGVGSGSATVYGRIPSTATAVAAGAYADNVTVTVAY
jgi:spore coat protein U-like protein